MIGKALTVASVLATTQAQNQYVASFMDNDISGAVTVDNGMVTVELDLSAMPDLPGNFSFCTTGGLSYHIHELWEFNDSRTESTMCGGDYTGGHWDPWLACGAASGNPYCGDGTGTQCIPKSAYSVDFPAMPFSAEVGDWSSKYGKLMMDDEMMISSMQSNYYEVMPEEMMGYSVVFHCNEGARAFCAVFEESADPVTQTIPGQGSSMGARVIFSELAAGLLPSEVTITSSGSVSGFIAAQDVFTDAATDGCATFEYGVFEVGSVALTESAVGDGCDGAVGDFYDPTHQCPSWSGSEYCTDGLLCGDAGYAYDCDFEADRYSCAPGDFSGKFGPLDPTATLTFPTETMGALVPMASDLVGKVMAVYCSEEDQPELTVFACAPITEIGAATPAPTAGAVCASVKFGAIVVAAMLAYGGWWTQ
jgi:hypothetical protein